MSTQFNPDGPVGLQLKQNLIQELKNRFNCGEDAVDIAEFIVILIVSGKLYQEILGEVKEIADIAIDVAFIESVFKEIERLQGVPQQAPEPTPEAPQQNIAFHPIPGQDLKFHGVPEQAVNPFTGQSHPAHLIQTFPGQSFSGPVPGQTAFPGPIPGQTSFPGPLPGPPPNSFQPAHDTFQQPQLDQTADNIPSGPSTSFSLPEIPKGPKSMKRDFVTKRVGGVQKDSGKFDKSKSFALKNSANFQKVLNLPQNLTNFIQKTPKGRCPDFPNCENKECELAHPTKNCFAYPNCPNPAGTCNFLHPDQDQELIAALAISREKYAKSKEEFNERKNAEYERKNAELLITQASCKFGLRCGKDTCPFAHPTPANPSAKITTLDWCPEGKNCIDTECSKAHPPPATAKSVKLPDLNEIALEQCKFGASCTNQKCPRRHALLYMPCRTGNLCKRLDCTFAHAINEECRFGAKCGNKNCMYLHPEGRSVGLNTWSNGTGTANRVFVAGDAVEQVVQQ